MTLKISESKFSNLRAFLNEREYNFEERSHQEFLARGSNCVVNLYKNGKIVIQGSNNKEIEEIESFLQTLAIKSTKLF